MRALNELLHGPLDGGGVHGPVRHHRRRSVARQRRRLARRRLGGGFEAPRRESLPCALAKHNEMKMRSPPGPHSYTCLSLSVVVIVAPLPPPPPCRAVCRGWGQWALLSLRKRVHLPWNPKVNQHVHGLISFTHPLNKIVHGLRPGKSHSNDSYRINGEINDLFCSFSFKVMRIGSVTFCDPFMRWPLTTLTRLQS